MGACAAKPDKATHNDNVEPDIITKTRGYSPAKADSGLTSPSPFLEATTPSENQPPPASPLLASALAGTVSEQKYQLTQTTLQTLPSSQPKVLVEDQTARVRASKRTKPLPAHPPSPESATRPIATAGQTPPSTPPKSVVGSKRIQNSQQTGTAVASLSYAKMEPLTPLVQKLNARSAVASATAGVTAGVMQNKEIKDGTPLGKSADGNIQPSLQLLRNPGNENNTRDPQPQQRPIQRLTRTGLLFHQIDDPEFQRVCQRLRKKLNHDPWDEFKRYDDDGVGDYISDHPDTCEVRYEFDSFSGHIYPLSMLCSLGSSAKTIDIAYQANPVALQECDLWIGTPLHYACSYKAKPEVVEYLVHKRPEALEITNHFGRTPLHMCCLFRATAQTVSLLLQHYPQASELVDKDGYTPLHLACENGAPTETIELLIQTNPSLVLAKTRYGENPAGEIRYIVIASFCISSFSPYPADADRYDSTPLHFACAKGASKAVIEVLLNCDKEPLTHMDLMGQTPMHMAAGGGASADVVEMLVKVDPEGIDALTDKGETPLSIARRKNAPAAVLNLLSPP